MKKTSIRFRLMLIMICLTTLPVITITWVAANNTRNSVEKEIINTNSSRMMWADQYLNELIQQINSLFYTLQTDRRMMDGFDNIDSFGNSIRFATHAVYKTWADSVKAVSAN